VQRVRLGLCLGSGPGGNGGAPAFFGVGLRWNEALVLGALGKQRLNLWQRLIRQAQRSTERNGYRFRDSIYLHQLHFSVFLVVAINGFC